jgi:uncharacterized protein YqgV (UPF0045/DUF77 family)
MDNPVVFLHGFSETALFDMVKAVKNAAREANIDPESIAFASSTPTNMEWKIKNLVRAVRQEHEMMKGSGSKKADETKKIDRTKN